MQQALLERVSKSLPQADLADVNEVAASLIQQQAADLIVGLSATRKEVMRRVLAQGLRRGWSDTVLRARIAEVAGLDPRRATALQNYRNGMLAAGVPPARVESQTAAYAKRLLSDRVRIIAESEMRTALMNAQRLVWQDMQARGDYSPYAVRVTRVHKDERACSICKPQNGKRRSLNRDLTEGPPFHPRCRCEEEVEDRGVEKREDDPMIEKAITPGGRVGDDSPLAKPGYKGPRRLPNYIRMVAHAMERKGHPKGEAIHLAIGIVENWASGQGKVSAKVRAAAAKAVAEWRALNAKKSVSKADQTTWNFEDYQMIVQQLTEENVL